MQIYMCVCVYFSLFTLHEQKNIIAIMADGFVNITAASFLFRSNSSLITFVDAWTTKSAHILSTANKAITSEVVRSD